MQFVNRILSNILILQTVNEDFKYDLKHITSFSSVKDVMKHLEKVDERLRVAEVNKTQNECIAKLRKKYNLSTTYHDVIRSYLDVDCEPEKWIKYSGSDYEPFIINNPDNKEEKIVVMRLAPESSKAEIIKNWKEIEWWRDFLYNAYLKKKRNKKKVSARKNTMRDIAIFNLYKEKVNVKEIQKIINKKYSETTIGYEDVYKIIKRLEKTAKDIIMGKQG